MIVYYYESLNLILISFNCNLIDYFLYELFIIEISQ